MKKVFFTVVALVAFSVGSMANTIEVEVDLNVAIEKTQVATPGCRAAGGAAYSGAIAAGLTESQASGICWDVIVACNAAAREAEHMAE